MGGFALLHLRPLRHRPVRVAAAILGVAWGSALAVAVLTVQASVEGSVADLHDAGTADLVVSPRAPGGVNAESLREIEATSGVRLAAPVVRGDVAVNGVRVPLVGIDGRALQFAALPTDVRARFAPSDMASTDAPALTITDTGADQLDLEAGDTVTVYGADEQIRAARIGAVLDASAATQINAGLVAFADLATAQTLRGLDEGVDLVLVDLDERATASGVVEQLHDRLPTASIDRPQDVIDRELGLFRIARNQMLPIAVVALVVGAVLVFNSVNMTVLERRRQLANLRALGAERRQLLAGVLGQSALLGLIGGLLGAAAGLAIARPAIAQVSAVLADTIGTDISFHLDPVALPVVVLGATVAAAAAGLIPARRVITTSPIEALRRGGTPAEGGATTRWLPRPTIAGVAMVTASAVALVVGPAATATSAIGGVGGGFIVLTYGLAGPTTALAARALRRLGGIPGLAAAGITRNPQRVWVTATSLTIGVALTIAVAGGADNMRSFTADQFDSVADTDLWIGAAPMDQPTYDLRLPAALIDRVAQSDGVASTATATLAPLIVEDHQIIGIGINGPSNFPLLAAAPPDAQERTRDGTGAIISHQYAATYDLEVGDPINLPDIDVAVVHVVEAFSLAEHGMVAVADDVLRRAAPGTTGVNAIEVQFAERADREAVTDELRTLATAEGHPVAIETGEAASATLLANLDDLMAGIDGMLFVVVLIAGLAILNTVLTSVLERRRELGVLRAIGSSPRQLSHLISIEIITIVAIGTGTGLVLGEIIQWAGTTYAAAATPLPVAYEFAPRAVAGALIAATCATVVGAIVPIRTTRRLPMLDALAAD